MSGLSWEIGASVVLHAALFAGALIFRWEGEGRAPPRTQEVIMVELPGPAKSKTAVPQKAERAPTPPAGAPAPTPAPVPPRQSDLTFETPKAPPKQGQPKEDPKAAKVREEMLAEMRRRQLLQDLDAPVGKEDRIKASPDGVSDPSQAGTGRAATTSEIAKWGAEARRRVNPNWHPIVAVCQQNPTLATTVQITINGSGMQTAPPRVSTPSGNASADSWAMEAVEATKQLPPPPPTFPDGWTIDLKFSCKEAL